MDYILYNKKFLQMQRDYMDSSGLMRKMKNCKLEEFVNKNSNADKYQDYKKQYDKLNAKIKRNVFSLKKYFVENNAEFNKINFNFNLSFFNGYAIMEDTEVMTGDDYSKLNLEFLESYKEELQKILNEKKDQYNIINKSMNLQKEQYKQEFKESIQKSNNPLPRATALVSKFSKDYHQRQAIYNKVYFIQKETNKIESALEENNTNSK